jgi:cytochrome c oxidase subunit 2
MKDGSRVKVDEAYLRESILDPRARIGVGYDPIMPSFQGQLSEEQVLQLISYLKSLGTADSAAATPDADRSGS